MGPLVSGNLSFFLLSLFMLGFITWTWNPEFFSGAGTFLSSLSIRWYGLMWALGLMLGYLVESKIYDREKMPEGSMDKLFLVMVFSTILGARLGHCFCYEWDYFSQHPNELLYIWKGGLSSHGGAFGILTALFFFSKFGIHKSYIWTLDRIVIAVAICGACIRLGNLFNHEIYGDPTSMPWAFSFMLHPMSSMPTGMSEPSHPTQIYEMLYCLVTFGILMYLYWRTKAAQHSGLLFSIFLLGIFLTRYVLEFIKRPQEDFEENLLLNVGQRLSLPFVFVGSAIIIYLLYKWATSNAEVRTKAFGCIGAFVMAMAAIMVLPLLNKKTQLDMAKIADAKVAPEVGECVQMDAAQVLDFLNKTSFVSQEGLRMHFNGGYIYVQGQKVAGPMQVAVSSNGYYLSAEGAHPNTIYRYMLRVYPQGRSVLLNLKDLRGNYAEESKALAN